MAAETEVTLARGSFRPCALKVCPVNEAKTLFGGRKIPISVGSGVFRKRYEVVAFYRILKGYSGQGAYAGGLSSVW